MGLGKMAHIMVGLEMITVILAPLMLQATYLFQDILIQVPVRQLLHQEVISPAMEGVPMRMLFW